MNCLRLWVVGLFCFGDECLGLPLVWISVCYWCVFDLLLVCCLVFLLGGLA